MFTVCKELILECMLYGHPAYSASFVLFVLSRRAYDLSDFNECVVNNGDCEQQCTNTITSFNCLCTSGYILEANGFNCSGKSLFVLMAHSTKFYTRK